jgi:hypothetical protein
MASRTLRLDPRPAEAPSTPRAALHTVWSPWFVARTQEPATSKIREDQLGGLILHASELVHQSGLTTRSLILVNHTLGGSLINTLQSQTNRCFILAGHRVLDARLEFRSHCLVPLTAALILTNTLDLTLNVCQGRLSQLRSKLRLPLKIRSTSIAYVLTRHAIP